MSSSIPISLSDIAVIVAAKNEEKNIKSCVESIIQATESATEIIVVNDGSTDRTGWLLDDFGSRIKHIKTQGVGPAAARNLAVHSTSKDYIAFVDADCVVDQHWLVHLSAELKNQYVGVGGAQKIFQNATFWDKFNSKFLNYAGFISDYVHGGKLTKEVNHNPTCNVLYVKEALVSIGGFDEKLWPCEDLDLDIRLKKRGDRLLFNPEAIIFHHRPDSLFGFLKMMKRYGFGQAQLVKKHGPCQKIHILPILFILYFALLGFQPLIGLKIFIVCILTAIFIFLIRSKSLLASIFYGFYVVPTVLTWNVGFFHGLLVARNRTVK